MLYVQWNIGVWGVSWTFHGERVGVKQYLRYTSEKLCPRKIHVIIRYYFYWYCIRPKVYNQPSVSSALIFYLDFFIMKFLCKSHIVEYNLYIPQMPEY